MIGMNVFSKDDDSSHLVLKEDVFISNNSLFY